jgi:ribosomal-protein-alanine N-acetyltransferase
MSRPTLQTERMILRPITLDDAAVIQRLAGDRKVAATTLLIPHPYPDGAAEEWINTHAESWEQKQSLTLAMSDRESGALMGVIGMTVNADHDSAEIGYWIGVPYWNQGFTTEAARAIIAFGFE